MSIKCSAEIFKLLEKKCGYFVQFTDGEEKNFLYTALFDGFEFSDLININIPDLDNKTFNNWQKFECWCEEIYPQANLMSNIVDEKISNGDFDDSNKTPKKYFGSKEKVKELLINVIRTSDSDAIESVVYVEIECANKKLYLLYFDQDSWTLGWGDTVFVISSLDELTQENGYYKRI